PVGDGSIIGRYLPQPLMGDAIGKMGRLDEILGEGFVVLGRDLDPTELLSADEKAKWDELGARYIAVRSQNAFSESGTDLIDLEGAIGAFMDRYGVRAIAVRPDRFIASSDQQQLAVPAL
ncbi:MAG: monooxygenase, partial [Propionibacteriaceae bacterium]|nr:monooxygenase [Propionibacteriaceae bacterium]